jgi:hypothetical protein
MGGFESHLMWTAYVEKDKEGVAIRSTVGKLQDACRKTDVEHVTHIKLARVAYVDHPQHIGDGSELDRYCVKDELFRGENEFRIIYDYSAGGDSPKGLNVEIDLKAIVDQVVLQPKASSELESKVHALQETSGLAFDVVRSRADRDVRF